MLTLKESMELAGANLLHTLCDIYQGIVDSTAAGLRINFHFDYEDEDLHLSSTRNQWATLQIWPKTSKPLFVRIPRWAPPDSVHLRVNEKPVPNQQIDGFLFVERQQPGGQIQIEYALPERTTSETTDEVEYQLSWRGDDLVGIKPNTDYLPFYPTGP